MIQIALDGPSGAGKSTIARKAAQILGLLYIDTGALYRTIAYYMLSQNIALENSASVIAALPQIQLELQFTEDKEQRILLNGTDVSDLIRTPAVGEGSSKVSAIPEVRDWLLQFQRDLAASNNVIMDGRDIGSVVLPHATVKLFLTATPQARAKRRCTDYTAKGIATDYEQVLKELQERDIRDMSREVAPLKPAEDSLIIDTTTLSFEQSLEQVLAAIRERSESHVL